LHDKLLSSQDAEKKILEGWLSSKYLIVFLPSSPGYSVAAKARKLIHENILI
jgi:hypothetical protein